MHFEEYENRLWAQGLKQNNQRKKIIPKNGTISLHASKNSFTRIFSSSSTSKKLCETPEKNVMLT